MHELRVLLPPRIQIARRSPHLDEQRSGLLYSFRFALRDRLELDDVLGELLTSGDELVHLQPFGKMLVRSLHPFAPEDGIVSNVDRVGRGMVLAESLVRLCRVVERVDDSRDFLIVVFEPFVQPIAIVRLKSELEGRSDLG